MKYLKLIGLTALAALALTAIMATSASAAIVCSTTGTGAACGAGHGKVYTGSIVSKNSGNVVFSVTNAEGKVINTITSTTSELAGEVTNGDTGVGKITKLTLTGVTASICTSVSATSSASTTNPWPLSVTTEVGGSQNTNGTMTIEHFTWTFSCDFLGFSVTCKYARPKVQVKVAGSDTEPTIIASNVLAELESGNNAAVCGLKADWTGTYKITTPASLFIE